MTTPQTNRTILKREQRVLAVPLTDQEFRERAEDMARVLDDKASAEAAAAAMKAEHAAAKATHEELMERLDAQLTKLGMEIRRRVEERAVEVEVTADYESGEILVVRSDSRDVVERRPMSKDERQAHLFPPTCDDAFERGRLARDWHAQEPRRPTPANVFPDGEARNVVRWAAGWKGDPDPGVPFLSPYEEALLGDEESTNPHSQGTEAHERWVAGWASRGLEPSQRKPDPASARTLGREARYRMAAAVVQGQDAELAELLLRWREPQEPEDMDAARRAEWRDGYDGPTTTIPNAEG